MALPVIDLFFANTHRRLPIKFTATPTPVAAILAILLTSMITPLMPYFLSFAAGAMIYVVVEELIPEASSGTHTNHATIGFGIGFIIMMILDVALGIE